MERNNISLDEIDKLSSLSALDFTPVERKTMQGQVSGILDMLDACDKVDGVSVVRECVSLNQLRDDAPIESLKRDDVLSHAPRTKNGYVVVPKVVD